MKRHPKNKSVLQRYEMQYPFAMEYHRKFADMDTATGYHICIASMHVRLGD